MARLHSWARYHLLVIASGLSLALGSLSLASAAEPTGTTLTGLHPFDREMISLIDKWEIPGASLAVSYKGRLVLARGYGFADRANQTPAQPTTLYRLGSLAKPMTAVATLLLVENGQVGLDDLILPLLGDLAPPENAITDPRVRTITVRQLLQHRMGLDRGKSGDPVFMPGNAAAAARQNASMPATCGTLLRDQLERELDFTPGERFAYSNVGYCKLGRNIEKISGESYEAFVRTHLLTPARIYHFRLAQTLTPAPGESAYYDFPGAKVQPAMPGVASGQVPFPYGGYSMEEMDSYGGWLGSPVEFLKFFLAIDGQRGKPLLHETTRQQMFERPAGQEGAAYYALGVMVRPVKTGINWWHDGSQPGAIALAVRAAEGYSWVAAFNMRPRDRKFFTELDQALGRAAVTVKHWPSGDLFAQFP